MSSQHGSPHALRPVHSARRIEIYRTNSSEPIITQNAETDKRPYIHPILAPDGVGELTENAPPHHPWQHGLYVGLNDVNGVGFWSEGQGKADGTYHPSGLEPPVVDGNRASWQVIADWKAPDGTDLLTETQAWDVHDAGEAFQLDMTWSLQAAVDITFGQYAYGGLFLRMPFRKEAGGTVLTSEGVGFPDAEGKRARWVAVCMPIEGRQNEAGIAIFDHPANSNHPNPWRVDGQFGIAPSRCISGAWQLSKGQSTVNRYGVFVFCGSIDGEAVESNWQVFSQS